MHNCVTNSNTASKLLVGGVYSELARPVSDLLPVFCIESSSVVLYPIYCPIVDTSVNLSNK